MHGRAVENACALAYHHKMTLALFQAGGQWEEESRSSQTFASISGWPLGVIYASCGAGVLYANIFKIHNESFITILKRTWLHASWFNEFFGCRLENRHTPMCWQKTHDCNREIFIHLVQYCLCEYLQSFLHVLEYSQYVSCNLCMFMFDLCSIWTIFGIFPSHSCCNYWCPAKVVLSLHNNFWTEKRSLFIKAFIFLSLSIPATSCCTSTYIKGKNLAKVQLNDNCLKMWNLKIKGKDPDDIIRWSIKINNTDQSLSAFDHRELIVFMLWTCISQN